MDIFGNHENEQAKKRPSLNEQILQHLREGNSISSKEAYLKFGCLSLAARINNIRKDGYLNKKEVVNINTDSENGKRFSRYTLIKK